MRLPLSGRLIATVLIAAIACFLYVIDAGLTASFASEDDTASQEEEAPGLESLTEQIAALEARVMELEANQDELAAQELTYPVFDAIAAVYLWTRSTFTHCMTSCTTARASCQETPGLSSAWCHCSRRLTGPRSWPMRRPH